jgi:hypothetical protein
LDFIRDLQEHLLKLGNGDKEFLRFAKPQPQQPGTHDTHTTRRQSRQLYKNYPRVRYVSEFDKEFDFLEWVPDYKKRVRSFLTTSLRLCVCVCVSFRADKLASILFLVMQREAAPIIKQEEYSAAALAEIQRQALEDLRAKQAAQAAPEQQASQ